MEVERTDGEKLAMAQIENAALQELLTVANNQIEQLNLKVDELRNEVRNSKAELDQKINELTHMRQQNELSSQGKNLFNLAFKLSYVRAFGFIRHFHSHGRNSNFEIQSDSCASSQWQPHDVRISRSCSRVGHAWRQLRKNRASDQGVR